MTNIVKLHEAPSLSDVPSMMRRIADQIEAGEHGDVTCAYFMIPTDEWPMLFGWGDIGAWNLIEQLERAKHWLVSRKTSR